MNNVALAAQGEVGPVPTKVCGLLQYICIGHSSSTPLGSADEKWLFLLRHNIINNVPESY